MWYIDIKDCDTVEPYELQEDWAAQIDFYCDIMGYVVDIEGNYAMVDPNFIDICIYL